MTSPLPTPRLSPEFLTGQVSEIASKVKTVEKKAKKAPEDLKTQLTAFLEVRNECVVEYPRGQRSCIPAATVYLWKPWQCNYQESLLNDYQSLPRMVVIYTIPGTN